MHSQKRSKICVKQEDRGTWIVAEAKEAPRHCITGVAGRKGFASVTVEKDRMQFGMIADIGAMLEQGNAEAAVIAAVLALEDEENPVLPKILSVMSGAQGRDK